MHSVLWPSIIASAVVAVITTLLAEYIAKPSLEARKERILDQKREKRQAIRGVWQALALLERLQGHKDGWPKSVTREYLITITSQFTQRVDTAFEALDIPESICDEWNRVTAGIITFDFAVQAGRPPAEAWKSLKSVTHELEIFYYYFRSPKWRLLYRRMLIKEIMSYPHYEDTEEVLEDSEQDESLPG